MKVLFILMMLVFGSAVKAESAGYEELFSPQENAKVLNAVDFICGDIWCEGYYDYKFLNLSCDKNSHQCELEFQFIESIDDSQKFYSPVQVCQIDGIYSLDQIIKDHDSLKFEFVDKLSNCFDNLAESFRAQ
jgi:hypothetical protein